MKIILNLARGFLNKSRKSLSYVFTSEYNIQFAIQLEISKKPDEQSDFFSEGYTSLFYALAEQNIINLCIHDHEFARKRFGHKVTAKTIGVCIQI